MSKKIYGYPLVRGSIFDSVTVISKMEIHKPFGYLKVSVLF